MKKKIQYPRDEIKAYLKVAQERLQQAFDVRPEWRHPKNAAGVNVVISRINEVYYPFSDRKRPKAAVWKRVLLDKRQAMIEEIEERNKTNPKNTAGDIKPGIEPVRAAATTHEVGKRDPEKGAGRELPSLHQPRKIISTKVYIERLRADIKSERAASKIARELELHPSYIKQILKENAGEKMKRWIPKIAEVFSKLSKSHGQYSEIRHIQGVLGPDVTALAAVDLAPVDEPQFEAELSPDGFTSQVGRINPNADRGLVDYPQQAATLISNMSVDIRDGKLIIQVQVDVTEAIRMHRAAQS